ncbi:uncharacterized protein IL334_001789 [Kwoniella shivajii]|uniref:PUB domain-containing protein n=1 Tax=Kwoniella shivajii TaxID=564305 RepID=A0ABZ1CSW6_9TREE|nr:hypothetical protein IL334_001789 [Kwoniella shivajii]
MTTPTPVVTQAERRAMMAAAVEARFRPPPSYDEIASSSSPDPSTYTTPAQPIHSPSVSAPVTPAQSRTINPAAQAAQARFNAQSNSTSNTPAVEQWKATEKGDRDCRKEFAKKLDRGIIRDNGYTNTLEAVETLIKISDNIINSQDPKFRKLKSSNSMLKNKVLDVKGGQDYLFALGFRRQSSDFIEYWVFSSTIKKMHELKIGAEVLKDHLKSLQERVELSKQSKIYGASVEASRRAAALAEFEADRDSVRARAERERIVREAKEAKERQAREDELAKEAELVADRDDEERRELRDTVVRPTANTRQRSDGDDDEEEEEEEEEGAELPSYAEDRESRGWGGAGRRLGG